MITLLNSPILTAHGTYSYGPVSLEEARRLVRDEPWQSAIGHVATAEVLSTLLDVAVPMNRIRYVQEPGATALVLALRQRPPEGAVLNRREVEEIGYDFAILKRTK